MQTNNYITDLLDMAIARKWKSFQLRQDYLPYLQTKTGEEYLSFGQIYTSIEEIESDLEAIGLGSITKEQLNIQFWYYHSEIRRRKYRFEIIHEYENFYHPERPRVFHVTFHLTYKSERWNPEDEA